MAFRPFRRLMELFDVDTSGVSDGDALVYDAGSSKWIPGAGGGGGGAPTDAKYIVQQPDSGLSAEQALSALATGIVKNTTTTGVLSIATEETDYYKPGGTAVAVADGGTGASNASGARTNLGLVVGTDVQGHTANLDTYSSITPSANVQSVLSAADYAAIRTLLGLVIGTNVQAFDADLSTWAGLTPSAFFQTLVDDTDAATARATLGVIASLFKSGGAQAIALDTLAAPTDITTLNVSTSAHGLAPKLPNDATKYLDGTGAYSVPAGGGSTNPEDMNLIVAMEVFA